MPGGLIWTSKFQKLWRSSPPLALTDWKWFNLIGKPHRKKWWNAKAFKLLPLGTKYKNDCHRGRNKIIAGKFHVFSGHVLSKVFMTV